MKSKPEQIPETYDEMYVQGGYEGVFNLPYRHSKYYPLFKYVLRELKRCHATSVLEVGCGTGAFAHLLRDRSKIRYLGFDFSKLAVSLAKKRLGQDDLFFEADARDLKAYGSTFDAIVCTEVLEHVEEDLSVIEKWPDNIRVICSVPNFDSATHVRFFTATDEVRGRYGPSIAIEQITRIKQPVVTDISVNGYLRALRWKRNDPKALLDIMGCGSFEKVGGWFVFTGFKRARGV